MPACSHVPITHAYRNKKKNILMQLTPERASLTDYAIIGCHSGSVQLFRCQYLSVFQISFALGLGLHFQGFSVVKLTNVTQKYIDMSAHATRAYCFCCFRKFRNQPHSHQSSIAASQSCKCQEQKDLKRRLDHLRTF